MSAPSGARTLDLRYIRPVRYQLRQWCMNENLHNVGIEPTTLGLWDLRAANCANRAMIFTKIFGHTLDGIRTRNLWIRSPMRYPLRHKSITCYAVWSEVKWKKTLCIGPTGIWTRISGFRVHCANRYTIGPTVLCVCVCYNKIYLCVDRESNPDLVLGRHEF